MKICLLIQMGTARKEFEHQGPTIEIGRNPESQLVLESLGVSWDHARIDIGPKQATLTDLQSTNGTSLNGQLIRAMTRFNVGDLIGIGENGPRLLVTSLDLSTGGNSKGSPQLPPVVIPTLPPLPQPGKPPNAPMSATRKLLISSLEQQKNTNQKQKWSLAWASLLLLLLLLLLGGGFWLANQRVWNKISDIDDSLNTMSQKVDRWNDELRDDMRKNQEFLNAKLDRKFMDLINKENRQIEENLKVQGKLDQLTKSVTNLNELNQVLLKSRKEPIADPKDAPQPANEEAVAAIPPPKAEPERARAIVPAPKPALEPAKVQFEPGDRLDLIMKSGQVFSGSLIRLSPKQVTILSNPNWPERPTNLDMRDVQGIQTKDGLFAWNEKVGSFVRALTSYRKQLGSRSFIRVEDTGQDLFLSENAKLMGQKDVNGLISIDSGGEIVVSLPLMDGPREISASVFQSIVTPRGIYDWNEDKGNYTFKTHLQIAREIREATDRKWKEFTEAEYKRKMANYEAATRRAAALSGFLLRSWRWW